MIEHRASLLDPLVFQERRCRYLQRRKKKLFFVLVLSFLSLISLFILSLILSLILSPSFSLASSPPVSPSQTRIAQIIPVCRNSRSISVRFTLTWNPASSRRLTILL